MAYIEQSYTLPKFLRSRSRFFHISARISTLPRQKDAFGVEHPERNVVMQGQTYNAGRNADKRSTKSMKALVAGGWLAAG